MRASLFGSFVLTLLACSPSSPASDAGAPPDTSPPGDAGPMADVGADAGGCVSDTTGGYVFTGSCTTSGLDLIPFVCVDSQTMCDAQVDFASFPPMSAPGTVAGDTVSFSGCTMRTSGVPSLHCSVSGGATCSGTGSRVSFPGATRYCCHVGGTSTGCATGERCTIVSSDDTNAQALTACVPAGSLTEGMPCTRMGGRVGADDCGAGLSCANLGQPDLGTRTCQRLCSTEADCHSGEHCLWLGPTPAAGVCTQRCTIGGTDCPTGNTCRSGGITLLASAAYASYCQQTGTGALGATCNQSTDCGANLVCPLSGDSTTVANTCRPTCDTAHPCAAGTCTPFMGVPNADGGGFCS